MSKSLLLVGAGPMSIEHFKAAQALGVDVTVCGRGEASADAFEAATGTRPLTGELKDQLASLKSLPSHALVAVNVAQLGPVTQHLMDAGVSRILLEKPGGATLDQIAELAAADHDSRIRLAYNRRFFPSMQTARECVREDGGLTSMLIEFNENRPLIASIDKHGAEVKSNWFFANSTHVVDSAFFVAGLPGEVPEHPVQAFTRGDAQALPPLVSYSGAGAIDEWVYSWHADWRSAGRWGLEICTPKRRLILKPMETLQEMASGSFRMTPVELIMAEPEGVKPGLYNMISCFMENPDHEDLLTMRDQLSRLRVFNRMITPTSEIA
ncbi:MAG: hypothetical protein GYB36_00930 [Alphaproteobacteria bacterium]|nr:hypothetical protein [Alphaproteobacteria bacterium]